MNRPDDIAAKTVELTRRADRDAAVAELVALAGHRRQPLEQATDAFIARLHRRSDDFEATHALRLLHRALDAVGWDTPPGTTTERHRLPLRERIAQLFRGRRPEPGPARRAPRPATV